MPRRHARPRRAQASPSAPPSAICPTPATQNDGRCEFVPRLPRRTKVNVTKCHACHAECRGVTRDQGAPKPVQARHPVPSVPRLPRKTTVEVSLCHACHAECRGVTRDQGAPTPATQNAAASRATKARPSQSKRATQCHLSHACHAKRRYLCHACHAE